MKNYYNQLVFTVFGEFSIATILCNLINTRFNHKILHAHKMAKNTETKTETAAVKTNEANLEELNRKIVEIKRKIVLSGDSFINSLNLSLPLSPQLTFFSSPTIHQHIKSPLLTFYMP